MFYSFKEYIYPSPAPLYPPIMASTHTQHSNDLEP